MSVEGDYTFVTQQSLLVGQYVHYFKKKVKKELSGYIHKDHFWQFLFYLKKQNMYNNSSKAGEEQLNHNAISAFNVNSLSKCDPTIYVMMKQYNPWPEHIFLIPSS